MNETRPRASSKDEMLEKAISIALEQQQMPVISPDFAARVAAKAAALPQRRRAPRAIYARAVSLLLIAVLTVVLFVVAPHAQPTFSSIGFDVELTVVAMLATLVCLLTQVPRESL